MNYKLFTTLLYYYHRNPISVDDCKSYLAVEALLDFIYSTGSVSLFKPTIPKGSYYVTQKYTITHCLNCKTTRNIRAYIRGCFINECCDCNTISTDSLVLESTYASVEEAKLYNPMVAVFEYLDTSTQKNILNYILTGDTP